MAIKVQGIVVIDDSQNVYASNIYSNDASVLTTSTVVAGTDTVVVINGSNLVIWNNSTLQSVTDRGATSNNAVSITNTSSASSTATGALQVVGGVGIGQNLYVGGNFRASTGATSQQIINNASGTVSLDFSLHDHFLLNMTGNVTLSPVNLDNKIGCTGNILFQQDTVGGWTFNKPSTMKTPLGGATIVQVTASNSLSLLTYYVVNTTTIIVNYIGDFA